jgi:hypothetical protein
MSRIARAGDLVGGDGRFDRSQVGGIERELQGAERFGKLVADEMADRSTGERGPRRSA